ncbi:MAG: FtsX-like permease family protein [bacterium]|nr:FtsX-like permease family protein [bacterium]
MGPMLRALLRNPVRPGLLVVEIAVTLAIVINCLSVLVDQRAELTQPTGIDEANIIAVTMLPWDSEYEDDTFRNSLVNRDMDRLRSLTGVVDASAFRPFPLQGGGSSMQVKTLGAPDEAKIRTPVYRADEHALDTLGLELVAGRNFAPDDVPMEPGPRILNVIVTQAVADALYPDGNALGQSIDTGSEEWPDVIVGIVRRMHTPYGGGPMEDQIVIYPATTRSGSYMTYLVRAEPGQRDGLIPVIEEALLSEDERRVINIRTLMEYKAQGNTLTSLLAGVLGTIIFLLLFVTSLGLFGMTSFSVTQRTREVGVRRALGATRGNMMRQFLFESFLITAVGTGLGLAGAVGLNMMLVGTMEAKVLAPGFAIFGVAILWLVGLVATIAPAYRASCLAPALATRTV